MSKPDGEVDFFQEFLHYTRGTEVPTFFYRWAAISALGAWLGRDTAVQFGPDLIYPNLYVLMVGEPGTKKSTAIKRAKKLLRLAGYRKFAAEKTSKEKFLLDLGEDEHGEDEGDDFLTANLFDESEAREVYISADEFNDFFGNNILDFVSLLGVLWDYSGTYENKIKNGESVKIPNPTVSILGGTTATTFAATFPQEIIGQGFFSRVVTVTAAPTGKRITWPTTPTEEETRNLINRLLEIKSRCPQVYQFTQEAADMVDKIYQTWVPVDDIRFASYSNRRLMHLLKCITIHAAARCAEKIEVQDVIYANTVLHHTEQSMPKAYGEFGQSRSSVLTHKIMQILLNVTNAEFPSPMELWAKVQSDFDKLDGFMSLLQNMTQAKKIQVIDGKLLPVRTVREALEDGTVDYDYLTEEEL